MWIKFVYIAVHKNLFYFQTEIKVAFETRELKFIAPTLYTLLYMRFFTDRYEWIASSSTFIYVIYITMYTKMLESIKHDLHVGFQTTNKTRYKNSYTVLWRAI
jgi:hypothetical protein